MTASAPPPPGPPERWRRLLARVLREDGRGEIVEELDDLWARRVEREGPRAAGRWYRREVVTYLALLPLAAWRRARRSRPGREDVVGGWTRDVRRALRSLLRTPGFTAMAVATLALGIGANTLIFSVVDHVVLRPLPYDRPEGLVTIWDGMQRREIQIVRERNHTLEEVAGYLEVEGFNLEVAGTGVRVDGLVADDRLLPLLGVRPALGRAFRPEETTPGRGDVALLSHGLWMDRFGGDPGVVGRAVRIDGVAREVVGILPAGFAFPTDGLDVVVPMVYDPADTNLMWGWGGHRIVARMLPGVTPAEVRSDVLGAAEASRVENPFWTPNPGYRDGSPVRRLQDGLVGDARPALLLLLGAVGLVLLVACANVANLLLTRGLGRSRDVALRTALGASRTRIVREHLVESVVLALGGCALALAGAAWTLRIVVALLPPGIPRAGEISLDLRIAGVGVVLALVAGVAAGLLPAVRTSRADPGTVLREGGRGGTGSVGRRRLGTAMVVAQMAAAVVLVVGAGLLVRSLAALNEVDPGFDPEGLTTARLTLEGTGHDDDASRLDFLRRAVERVRGVPGVRDASAASRVPFGEGWEGWAVFVDGVTDDPNDLPVIDRYRILPGYLETLGVELLQGRSLLPSDAPGAPLVALVDRTMADHFWPGASPVGRRIRYPWRGAPWIEVVGVVGAVRHDDLAAAAVPSFYVPLAQSPGPDATLVVRAEDPEVPLAGVLREVIREVDPRVPLSAVAAADELLAGSLARSRWLAVLLGMFAGVTLLLGCVGVYGVLAHSVRERTKEIGVRAALGADPGRIRARILGEGLRLALPGALLGLALAVPAAGLMEGMLFGVEALDPVTFAAVPLVLLGAGTLAVWWPALRATRVDPVEALRAEG